jgi:hypothetical protein
VIKENRFELEVLNAILAKKKACVDLNFWMDISHDLQQKSHLFFSALDDNVD